MRGLVRAATCGLIGAALMLAAPGAAVAQQDDEPSFDQKIRDGFMSALGIKPGPDIDYRERSPLVLPPRIDLPPPQANTTSTAPNWPVDADQKRRREEGRKPRDIDVEESRALRPSELNVGQPTRSRTPAPTQDQIEGKPVRPSDLGYTGGILGSLWGGNKEEAVQFTREPPRTTLTEPPVGYQTPSPNHPYAAKPEKWAPKIPSFFDFGTDTK
jgi:hypothetical protein